jgi:hypothetical protein
MVKFQLHLLMRLRFAKLWKLLALFSSRVTVAAKAYDFGSRTGELIKDLPITRNKRVELADASRRANPPRTVDRLINMQLRVEEL